MESWAQLPPAHGYASPSTMKVRGLAMDVIGGTRPMRVAVKSAHSPGDRGWTRAAVGQGG